MPRHRWPRMEQHICINIHLEDAFIQSNLQKVHLSEERETKIYLCWYSKDVHSVKHQQSLG